MRIYTKRKPLALWAKIVLTVLILILYRLFSHIPLPFVDTNYLKSMFDAGGSLSMLNLLTGGNLETMSFVALGITPYITSSILVQLLGVAFPRLGQMQKNGAVGQDKMKKVTLILSCVLAFIQSVAMMAGYGKQGLLSQVNWYSVLIPSVIMTISTTVLSIAGLCITDKLFGNGISLILVTGILCSYGPDSIKMVATISSRNAFWWQMAIILAVVMSLFAFTVWLMYCEKRISVVYSMKIQRGANKIAQEQSIIPLKLVGGGVVPVIFASSILTIPMIVQSFTGWEVLDIFNVSKWLNADEWWASLGIVFYFAMILGFSYYYQMLNLNPRELSQNLKKCGGMIAGVRPGKPTEEYLTKQMKYLTLLGGVGLCIIAFIPICVTSLLGLHNLSFLGTSIIIVVSVLLDVGKQLSVDLKNRCYKMPNLVTDKTKI